MWIQGPNSRLSPALQQTTGAKRVAVIGAESPGSAAAWLFESLSGHRLRPRRRLHRLQPAERSSPRCSIIQASRPWVAAWVSRLPPTVANSRAPRCRNCERCQKRLGERQTPRLYFISADRPRGRALVRWWPI